MSEEINLLGNSNTRSGDRFAVIMRRVSLSFLTLVAFLSILFFFLKANSSLSRLQTEESALVSQLESLKIKTAKFLFIKDRLGSSQTLMAGRLDLDKSLSVLQKGIGEGLFVVRLTLTKNDYLISLESGSLSKMHAYVDTFEKETSKNAIFKTAKIDGITFDQKNAKYSVTIQGTLR